MFCKHCGTKLKPNGKFCETCGNSRDIDDENQKDDKKISPLDNKKQFSPIAFLCIVIAIVVAIGIISAITSSNFHQGSSTATSSSINNVTSSISSSNKVTNLPVHVSQKNTQSINQGLQNVPANTNLNITTSFIKQIEPAIVLVVCFPPNYSGGDFDYGSGVSVDYDKTTYIETNYHVYNGENTEGGSPTCFAYYPGSAPDFSINSQSGGYQLNFHGYNYNPDTSEDVADFTLGPSVSSSTPLNSIPVINNTTLTGIGLGCSNVNNGDSVTIFGYPASGNYLDVSETVTQGTISGQTPGPIYKFDGAIDHGNSGGLAVLDKDSCDLGIPTLGVSGLTAGTGYIQSVILARQPVKLSNDQICKNQYGVNSVYTGNNSQGGLICDCTSGYTWNTGDTACVAVPAETGYQVCSETYPNETWNGTYDSSGQYNCVCDSGYFFYGSQCVSGYTYCTDTEGYGASYNISTDSCICDAGYIYNGGQCEAGSLYCSIRYGIGTEYNYSTGGCECEFGYESNGNECVYVGY